MEYKKEEIIHKACKPITEVDEMNNLKEMLAIVRKNYGKKEAFVFKTDKPNEFTYKTYDEYLDEIEALGTALINAGLKGKRIAVISENRYEWTLGYLATVTGTGIVVPLDKSLPEQELKNSLERSEAEAVIYSEKYEKIMASLVDNPNNKVKYYISMDKEKSENGMYSLKELIKIGKELIADGDRRFLDSEIDNEAMSIMLFTSGTTAQSKAVMLSHRNIISNLKDIAGTFDVTSEDRFLSFLPLHHVFECTVGFLYPVYRGGLIAYCDGIRHIAENLKEYQISAMISVPILFESMYKQLWKSIEKMGMTKKVKMGLKISNFLMKIGIDVRRKIFKQIIDNLGGKVRLFVAGAAAFDKDVEKGFNDFGIATYQGYGLTETAPVLASEHPTVVKYGSIGMLFPQIQGKIFEPDENGMGELVVKAPNVMMGYYGNSEATKEAIDEDGWFHTGDLAYFDKDDYLFITGRKKSVIVLKNGKNVFPEELESLVNQLEGVKESFVYGKPDENDEADLTLNVKVVYDKDIMKDKFGLEDENEIKAKLWKDVKEINKTMPTYKYIKGISVTTEELIKTTTLKIKRFEEIKRV
jgi:long-chain acyl-CoA synthetase